MATDTARSTAPSAARQLWQVPAFLLGLATLIAVPLTRPYWSNDLAAVERQLYAARLALEQSPPDAAQTVQRGRRVLDAQDRFPQFAGEAHFIVGSAHLRLADEPGADAAEERRQARQHLEQAADKGVPEADQPKLQYRLGKVWALFGVEAPQVVAALTKGIEAADDPAEGYGLLAQAYLRLNPPDLVQALDATKQQLQRSNDARVQAQARLQLGKLYLQLKNVKEGQQWLGRVGADAPPEQFLAARLLQAESHEADQQWEQSARNWEQARQSPLLKPADKGRLLYHLGRCYAEQQRPTEATAVWQEALALGGDEAQAAALRLAELQLDAEARPDAVAALAAALRPVQGPDDYRNKLVPLAEARQLVEKAAQVCRAQGDWETAQKVAELYGRLAPPSGADVMAGLTADEWAKALAEQARQAAPEQQAALEEQAQAQLKAAGLAYEKAAGKAAPGAEQANWLWSSADRLLRARELAHAVEVLTRYTRLEGTAPGGQMPRAWFELAQAHHSLQQYAAARAAYQHCLQAGNPFLLRARLKLAQIDLTESRFDPAEQALQENKKALLEANPPDGELQEQTLFTLAEVAFQRQEAVKEELREYGTAAERLRGALAQYPDGPAALRGQILLGVCYWNQAWFKDRALRQASLSEEERQSYRRQMDDFLQKAAEQYERVESKLLARQRAGGRLSAEEEVYLKQASFWGADCYVWLRKYDELVRRYWALAVRYQQRPEELIALSQIWYCHAFFLKQPDKAAEVLGRLRATLDKMPEAAFTGNLPTHRRKYWTDWLANVANAKPPAP
jgi:hypothetical protein